MDCSHNGKQLDSSNGFNIINCENCGFVHITPLPSAAALTKTYQHDYYVKDKPLSIARHEEDRDWHELQYADRYDTFESFLRDDQRRILDVGCGPGYFLRHGQEKGWQVLGLEPSTQASDHARGLGVEVFQEFLQSDNAGHFGLFDAVHASLVIEHISDPADFIHNIHTLTKPGGIICITAPNDYNPVQQALRLDQGFEPWWLCCPHHINYFSPDSLSRLLERQGFEVVLRESTFPIDFFLLMGDNYIGNDALGRSCHKKRMRLEQSLATAGFNNIKRELYRALAKLNLGREICIYARKPA